MEGIFMNYNVETLKYYLKGILSIPSPSGYTSKVMNYIRDELNILHVKYSTTNKGSLIIQLKGKNDAAQRTLSAHIDTLGAMVREIKDSGTLSISPVGGFMMSSIDGENCLVHTLGEKVYTGVIHTIKPSVHVSGDEARNLKRIPENMELVIDEKVFSKLDVLDLGIDVGDFISFDPRTIITENGFVKSRHLDDKASAAILLYAIKYIAENSLVLPYTTNIYLSCYEEVGHGASSIPQNTVEFISVDMGAPGNDQNSSEYSVCICAQDSTGPYDYDLRKSLISICKENNIDYKIDLYPHYGSDASAAQRGGWDIRTALIGTGVYSSHAYERTHLDGMLATLDLIINYVVSN
jgi:putative aminopeptidase FrvX